MAGLGKLTPFQLHPNSTGVPIRVHPKTRMSRAHFPTPGGLASRQALHAVPPGWEKRPLEGGASFAVRGPGPTVHCHRDSSEEEMVPVSVLLMDC